MSNEPRRIVVLYRRDSAGAKLRFLSYKRALLTIGAEDYSDLVTALEGLSSTVKQWLQRAEMFAESACGAV
jgi:hypothetical protein